MRAAGLIVAAIALTGCDPGEAPVNASATAPERLTWRAAPGGGQVAMTDFATSGGDYRSGTATRCWSVGGAFDCVAVRSSSIGGYFARRFAANAPPETREAVEAATEGPGYACSFAPEHRLWSETISGERGVVIEQSWMAIAPKRPWTRRYVTGFMRDNNIVGSPWLKCFKIMQSLDRGSLETIATTSFSSLVVG